VPKINLTPGRQKRKYFSEFSLGHVSSQYKNIHFQCNFFEDMTNLGKQELVEVLHFKTFLIGVVQLHYKLLIIFFTITITINSDKILQL